MSSFYAVANGNKNGIFTNWLDCKTQIDNFDNPIFKKFDNYDEALLFIENFNNLYVYTDGACINNGSNNAKAGIGIYFYKDNPLNVSKELIQSDFEYKLTNNVAELQAAIEAIEMNKSQVELDFFFFFAEESTQQSSAYNVLPILC